MIARLAALALFAFLPYGCVSNNIVSNTGHPIDVTDNKITSWKRLNEQRIIMQKYDYSCGAASLATLMRYYFGDDVTEKTLLDQVISALTEEEYRVVEKNGLSFLELEKISKSLGYQSASVHLKITALREIQGPVVVYLSTKNYKHFAVFRGMQEDRVFLADPSRGNIILPISDFLKEWRGETLVLGKEGFGTPQNHPLAILLTSEFRNEMKLLYTPMTTLPASATKLKLE